MEIRLDQPTVMQYSLLDFHHFRHRIGKQVREDHIIQQLQEEAGYQVPLLLPQRHRTLPCLLFNGPGGACPLTVRMVLVPFPVVAPHRRRQWVGEVGRHTSSTEARLVVLGSRFSNDRGPGMLSRSTSSLTELQDFTGGTNRIPYGNSRFESTHRVLVNSQASRQPRLEMHFEAVAPRLMFVLGRVVVEVMRVNTNKMLLDVQSQKLSRRGSKSSEKMPLTF